MDTITETVRRNQSRRRWADRRGTCSGLLGIAVFGVALSVTPSARAAEPLRLHLVRSEADVSDTGAQCVRGELFAVRGFAEEARNVWLADTLEFPSAVELGGRVPQGLHVGVADSEGAMGLRIEVTDVETTLRAHPEGRAEHAPGVILVGRRPAAAGDGPCDPETERLEDGAALMRRLRDVYAARGGDRPIEILMGR